MHDYCTAPLPLPPTDKADRPTPLLTRRVIWRARASTFIVNEIYIEAELQDEHGCSVAGRTARVVPLCLLETGVCVCRGDNLCESAVCRGEESGEAEGCGAAVTSWPLLVLAGAVVFSLLCLGLAALVDPGLISILRGRPMVVRWCDEEGMDGREVEAGS